MALDGCMLRLIKNELEDKLLQGRVDKIHQPTKEEIIMSIRTYKGGYKILISAKADGPRIHLTNMSVENPKQPPMFCMLMRKHIGSGRLVAVRQQSFDRILFLDFETVNEMGDVVIVSICIEIMGRHSNIILLDANGKIIDSIKRVNFDMSSVRQVMPGMQYQLPSAQSKTSPISDSPELFDRLRGSESDIPLSTLLLENIEWTSPLLFRAISYFVARGSAMIKRDLTK